GCSLKALLRARGRLAPAEAAWVGEKVLQALAHAHAHGVIHRDLKPTNVFLTDEGNVKLLDFGLAKTGRGDDITKTGAVVGSFVYTAPEQILGEKPSVATDLYMFGILLFEMLAGTPPFAPGTGGDFAVMRQHLEAEPPDLLAVAPDAPPSWAVLMQRLLAKKPERRPRDADEVRRVLLTTTRPVIPRLPEGIQRFSELAAAQDDDTGKPQASALGFPEESIGAAIARPIASGSDVDPAALPDLEPSTIQRLKAAVARVPPLPAVWHEAQQCLADPAAAPQDLARILDRDPVLAAAVLRLAESAFFHGRKPEELSVAIARIGMARTQEFLFAWMAARIVPADTQALVPAVLHMQAVAFLMRELASLSRHIAPHHAG
ncbi:MAG: serine/threonine protein kinase, partial [Zetaproteobacteria bacterium]